MKWFPAAGTTTPQAPANVQLYRLGKVPEPADATQWCNATVRCNGAPEHVLARTCGRRPASSVSVFGIARPDQGNRVKVSRCDEPYEEVVVPCGDFSA